jgi:hypothetical protein
MCAAHLLAAITSGGGQSNASQLTAIIHEKDRQLQTLKQGTLGGPDHAAHLQLVV